MSYRNGDTVEEVPLFPLPQVALFPGAHLPLHVFEPRYRKLTRDALSSNQLMSVVQVLEEEPTTDSGPAIAQFAGLGKIVQHRELPDGRFNILVQGVARVHLSELPFLPPYRRAKATVAERVKTAASEADVLALLSSATRFIALLEPGDGQAGMDLPPGSDPGLVADLCAHQLVVEGCDRQSLLEELDDRKRILRCIETLATQTALLEHTSSLH